jgi:hypothetical protein
MITWSSILFVSGGEARPIKHVAQLQVVEITKFKNTLDQNSVSLRLMEKFRGTWIKRNEEAFSSTKSLGNIFCSLITVLS